MGLCVVSMIKIRSFSVDCSSVDLEHGVLVCFAEARFVFLPLYATRADAWIKSFPFGNMLSWLTVVRSHHSSSNSQTLSISVYLHIALLYTRYGAFP